MPKAAEPEHDVDLDPLHLSLQSIAELLDPAYWRAACPWLTCNATPPATSMPAPPPPGSVWPGARSGQGLVWGS
eukprot:gene2166-3083_t